MNYVSSKDDKISLIRTNFSNLLGKKITGYELAQIWFEETSEWSEWMDIPLFLCIGETTLSISWKKFDELAISEGRALSFSLCNSTVRWICEGVAELDKVVGHSIVSASLGRGEMSVNEADVEIWTRLLLELSNGFTLDVFNALDSNGVEVVTSQTIGEIHKCT